jgi:hypothetical protein
MEVGEPRLVERDRGPDSEKALLHGGGHCLGPVASAQFLVAVGDVTSNGSAWAASYNTLGPLTTMSKNGTTTSYGYLGEGEDEPYTENGLALHSDGRMSSRSSRAATRRSTICCGPGWSAFCM